MSSRTEIPADLELDNPLWRFAGSLWRKPEAETACLALQAQGWSVTNLICALWLSELKKTFSGMDDPQVLTWRSHVTEPLRQVRRSIRKNHPATDSARTRIAQSELAAEQVELALAYRALANTANTPPCGERAAQSLALDNLQAAAPEKTMDNETGTLLETLARQLPLPSSKETATC